MSHGRRVDRDSLRGLGVKIVDLESDQELQDKVLSVYHAVSHTFTLTGTVKNHRKPSRERNVPIS